MDVAIDASENMGRSKGGIQGGEGESIHKSICKTTVEKGGGGGADERRDIYLQTT